MRAIFICTPALAAVLFSPLCSAKDRLKAQLTIDSVPSGASIELNGKPAGQTPSSVSLEPGAAQITVKKPGFIVWTGNRALRAGERVKLKPKLKPAGDAKPEAGESATSVRRAGNGVSAPVVLYKVDPHYSKEARKLKLYGTVVLQLVVDATGRPRNVRIVRSLAFGLDENAIEAVNKWRFRPGYRDGKPVAVQATIEVNFRLL